MGPVLHLNTEATYRGGEVQTLGLLRELAKAGGRGFLAAPAGAPLARKAAELGVEVASWNPRGEWDLAAAWAVLREARRFGARILHAHTAHALTPALVAAALDPRLKVVATRRVSFPLRSRLSRIKYGRAHVVVAVSGTIQEALEASGIAPDRIRVIHSGVDLERFRDLPGRDQARRSLHVPQGAFVVGVAAALAPHKGHARFLSALSPRRGGFSDLHLLLAGDGPCRGDLEAMCAREALPVRFLGHLDDLRAFYGSLDVLVLPSLSGEGSPGAVKEAAAAGVPVVASEVGGVAEILRHEREALLVPPADSEGLWEAVHRLARDSRLREALASGAARRILEFGMDRMAGAYARLYADLTIPAPGGGGPSTGRRETGGGDTGGRGPGPRGG
ncbi:MAG: glycosyltransferase [Acidobacteriota bacterium]